jgi:hypothetical protein
MRTRSVLNRRSSFLLRLAFFPLRQSLGLLHRGLADVWRHGLASEARSRLAIPSEVRPPSNGDP